MINIAQKYATESEAEQERQIKITELNNKTCPIYLKSGICLNCASFYFGETVTCVWSSHKCRNGENNTLFFVLRPPKCCNGQVRSPELVENEE